VEDARAPGWDAITDALAALYPGVDPVHVTPGPGPAFGGGVQGISAYPSGDHWLLVTYGLTELYTKESENPEYSGWGYELTIRATSRTDAPPEWAFALLEAVARITQNSGTVFASTHRLDVRSPIDGGRSQLTAVAFVLDEALGTIDTAHGRVEFLQLVGVTDRELMEMKATSTDDVLARLAATNPFLVTDPDRLDEPDAV
jgi:suppressor of fused-like protein